MEPLNVAVALRALEVTSASLLDLSFGKRQTRMFLGYFVDPGLNVSGKCPLVNGLGNRYECELYLENRQEANCCARGLGL